MMRRAFRLFVSACAVPIAFAPYAHAASRGAPWRINVIDDTSRGADGVKVHDVNGDGLPDITTGWEEGGVTRVYLHPGRERVRAAWPAVTVGRTRSVEDAAFVDLDGDGATDVVSCCEGGTKAVFVHVSPSRRESLLDSAKWRQHVLGRSRGMMMWMFAVGAQIDGERGIDLVAAGKGGGATLGWFESPADPKRFDEYAWHPITDVGWIMSIIMRDMDADGDDDILVSDRRGRKRGCRWLENPGASRARDAIWRNHVIGGEGREVMFACAADLDADGLEDVLVAAKKADVLWFRRRDASGTSWDEHTIPYPENMGSAKGVAVGDMDGDGRRDIVVSCEHATAPRSGVVWMSSSGTGPDATWRADEISGPAGIKYDRIELYDVDGDGDLDVLTCEEREAKRGLGVFWYENPR